VADNPRMSGVERAQVPLARFGRSALGIADEADEAEFVAAKKVMTGPGRGHLREVREVRAGSSRLLGSHCT
jgi:hypothetical protein